MNKVELRKIYSSKRDALSKKEVQEHSLAIAAAFFKNFNLDKINFLHIFLPIGHKNEINSTVIIQGIRDRYPMVKLSASMSNFTDFSMKHYLLEPHIHTPVNQYGIPEPAGGIEVFSEEIDLVLIPLLAFDKKGNRLGYGKGFYDRFLSECKDDCIKIGLSLFEPVEAIEVESFDIKLNHCISPYHLYSFV